MAHTENICFSLDHDIKQGMDEVCRELGLDMITAFRIFAAKVSREQRIPFDLSLDPFYSASNMQHLCAIKKKIDDGKAHFTEHDLVEDNE